MTDKTKNYVEEYIRNIAQQEILKEKLDELKFKQSFDDLQRTMHYNIKIFYMN